MYSSIINKNYKQLLYNPKSLMMTIMPDNITKKSYVEKQILYYLTT